MTNVVALEQPATFEDFWKAYPRKIKKPLAMAKWNAITGGGLKTTTLDRDSNTYVTIELAATGEELVAAAERYRKHVYTGPGGNWKAPEMEFIPHPATWLNQGRWMDSW